MLMTKNMPLKWYSLMKKNGKIQKIFDIENWLWKSEIGSIWSPDIGRTLIYKSAIYYSIQLPFDVEIAEKW